MRKWTVLALLLGALFAALAAGITAPAAAGPAATYAYNEPFTTTTFQDVVHSTASWHTAQGHLRLHPPRPVAETADGHLYYPSSHTPAVYVPDTGRVYLFGSDDAPHAIQQYDPVSDSTVNSGPVLPWSMHGASAIYVPSRHAIYLLGGMTPDIMALDVGQMVTTVLDHKLPSARPYASAVYVPGMDKAYIFGGLGPGDSEVDSILEYDLQTGTVITLPATLPLPMGRTSAVYDPVTDSAYIFGGRAYGAALSFILRFDVQDQTITSVGSLPAPCSDSCAVYVPEQHKAYVFGGLGTYYPLSQIVEFDIASSAATALAAKLPYGRYGAAAVYVPSQHNVCILGGTYGGGGLPDVVPFDVDAHTVSWTYVGVDGRNGASAIYVPGTKKAYLFAGQSAYYREAVVHSILAYDVDRVATDVLAATLPVSRTDTAAVYDPTANQGYVFGGWRPDGTDQYFDDILRFDAATETITPASAVLPTGRAGMAAVYVPTKGKVYLFGGFDASGTLDEILVYDPTHDTAPTTLTETLPKRAAHAAAVYDAAAGKVYLFGGYYGGDPINSRQDIVSFDVASETASLLSQSRLPWPLSKAPAIAFPGDHTAYIIGGTFGIWYHLDSIFGFDTATETATEVPGIRLSEARSGEAAVYVPENMSLYLFGGTGSQGQHLFSIATLEFSYPLSETAQSLHVNVRGGQVLEATLTPVQDLRGGSVAYSLSNDGGQTWSDVQPGVKHVFTSPGPDLRWRAVLSGNGQTTPIVDSLTITYEAEGHEVFLPVAIKGRK